MVLDTETTNTVQFPYVYDIGFVIVDRAGVVYEKKRFIVKDVFGNRALMASAYYAKKIPLYESLIKKFPWCYKNWADIKLKMNLLIDKYNIKKIYAYNATFDARAIKTTEMLLNNNRTQFFDRDVQWCCLWNMACNDIMQTNKYWTYCIDNGYVSEKGNVLTNAEVLYKYINNTHDFEEDHMALEDAVIESQILTKLWQRKKKMYSKPNGMCWKIPQRRIGA